MNQKKKRTKRKTKKQKNQTQVERQALKWKAYRK